MRYALSFILIVLLAACGGGGNGDSDNADATSAPSGEETVAVEDGTLSFEELAEDVLGDEPTPQIFPTVTLAEGALPIPLPGTLVASETEEPDLRGVGFDRIVFRQSGGTAGIDVQFEINGQDRSVTRDGNTMAISQEAVDQINQAIDSLNFLGLQGTFLGPGGNEEAYFYRITVEKGDAARTIASQDGFMPQEYIQFLGLLRTIGDSVIISPTSVPVSQPTENPGG